MRSCLENPQPRKRQQEGSQTCNVWHTRHLDSRAEGAGRNFGARLQRANVDSLNTRRCTSGYLLLAPSAQATIFQTSSEGLGRVRMLIKRYGISRRAAQELKAMRLTIGDVAVILRWGEKRRAGNMTSYLFEQRCLPSVQEEKVRRLLGVEVVTVGRRIECIRRSFETKPSRGREVIDD